MTNSDVQDTRDVLDDGLEGRPSRPSGRALAAASAAVAVMAGIAGWQALVDDAPADPGPVTTAPSAAAGVDDVPVLSTGDQAFLAGDAPTPELLRGLWRLDNPTDSRMLFLFTDDGGFRYDDSGNLTEQPLATGNYRVEGDTISVDVDGGVAGCAGQTLVLRGAVNDLGGLNLVPVDADPTSCDRPARHRWVLEQLLPTNPGWMAFTAPRGPHWDPLPGPESLVGTWLAGGGGYVIELHEDGTFTRLAGAGEVVDRGTWADGASTSMLTLTSGEESPTCRPGDRFALSQLRGRDLGTLAIQGEVERDDCGVPPWFGWFLLSS